MTKSEEPLQQLRAISNEDLDKFRQALPSLPTSELLAYLMNSDTLFEHFAGESEEDDEEEEDYDNANENLKLVVAAAAVAVLDELDLRIPARARTS